MRVMGWVALAVFAFAAPGADRIAIKAGKIFTVSGEVISPGVILIEDGKIIEVRKGTAVPEGATVIDATTQVVIPGLIDGSSTLDGGADADRTIAPDIQAVDGYDWFAVQRLQLSGGITTTCITPGSRRLLTGRGAVVKTAGDRERRVLRASFGLRVTLGDAPKNPPGILKAPLPASSDDPITPVARQYPVSRMGQFAALRKCFAEAKAARGRDAKSAAPLLDVLGGRQPLLVVAHTADDIIKAVLFGDELGIRIILVDAEEAATASDLLAARKIPVILATTKRAEVASSAEGTQAASAAATLVGQGVRLALHPADDDSRDLLLLAAYAVRNGLSEEQALRAITLGAAEMLSVGERVGSIEKGKDADLVFLNADPLSGTAMPQRVMVDGRFVFERKEGDIRTYAAVGADSAAGGKKQVTAIRGGRFLTVNQGIVNDGLMLIEDGKITYVGRDRALPAGVTVIDATGLTVTPGMIDLHTTLGFQAERNETAERQRRTGGIPANTVNPASDYLKLDDPRFAEVAASGVTCVLVAPDQTGVCSAVKLGAKAEVIRPVAAVKFVVGNGTASFQQAKQFLDRAKKYHEEWEAIEKAPKEAPPPKPAESAPPTVADPITGSWKGSIEMEGMGRAQEFTAELKLAGKEVTGTLTNAMGNQPVKGTFENGELRIEQEQGGAKILMVLKAADGAMTGTIEIHVQGRVLKGKLEAKRLSGGSTSATPTAPAKAAPRKDDQLEAWRKVFRKEIPVLVVARDVPSIDNATRLLKSDFDLDYVLLGADQADYLSTTVATRGASVALGPDFLREERGTTSNLAEALASSGISVAITTGTSGTRDLALYAVRAVRYGLDPAEALKGVTAGPARMAKLDGRLGSLERGRDADLVFYSGEPFNLASQVRRVMVSGKIVFEKR